MSLIPVWLQSRYIDRVTEIPVVVDLPGQVPAYAREGDAGADLRTTQAITLDPGERALVGTGVCIGLPAGTVGLVTPGPDWPRAVGWGSSIVLASSTRVIVVRSAFV